MESMLPLVMSLWVLGLSNFYCGFFMFPNKVIYSNTAWVTSQWGISAVPKLPGENRRWSSAAMPDSRGAAPSLASLEATSFIPPEGHMSQAITMVRMAGNCGGGNDRVVGHQVDIRILLGWGNTEPRWQQWLQRAESQKSFWLDAGLPFTLAAKLGALQVAPNRWQAMLGMVHRVPPERQNSAGRSEIFNSYVKWLEGIRTLETNGSSLRSWGEISTWLCHVLGSRCSRTFCYCCVLLHRTAWPTLWQPFQAWTSPTGLCRTSLRRSWGEHSCFEKNEAGFQTTSSNGGEFSPPCYKPGCRPPFVCQCSDTPRHECLWSLQLSALPTGRRSCRNSQSFSAEVAWYKMYRGLAPTHSLETEFSVQRQTESGLPAKHCDIFKHHWAKTAEASRCSVEAGVSTTIQVHQSEEL